MVWSVPGWVFFLTRGTVHPWTWTDCKLGAFLFFFSAHFSSALLMSIEKAFVLYFPLETQKFSTVDKAKRVCFFIALLFVVFEFQWFIIYDARTQKSVQKCVWIFPGYRAILLRINSVQYSFAPFTLMVMANGAIVYKFVMAKYKNAQNDSVTTNQALSKSATWGTVMLISVSLAFIIFTGPFLVYQFTSNLLMYTNISKSVEIILLIVKIHIEQMNSQHYTAIAFSSLDK